MGEFVITCCSTADMDRNFFEEREIPFACFHCLMDGKEYQDDLGKSMAPEEFYRRIAAGAQPTTAQVNVKEYEDLFRPALEQGKDVLHIALSGGISGAVNSARLAKEQLEEEFPERRILVVGFPGSFLRLWTAGNAGGRYEEKGSRPGGDGGLDGGTSAEYPSLVLLFGPDQFYPGRPDLKDSRILRDGSGDMSPDERGRQWKTGAQREVSGEKESDPRHGGKDEGTCQRRENYSGRCLISQSACYEDARAVADLVEQEFPRLSGPVEIHSIGMVIGSHTGPGTVALFFEGDQRQ